MAMKGSRSRSKNQVAVLIWAQQISSAAIQVPLLTYGGFWLDQQWNTPPWLLLLGAVLGMCSAGWTLYRTVRYFDRQGQDDPSEQD